MIVHGIPGDYVLKEGDILSIDCGAIIEGWHGDAARTIPVGEVSPEAERLMRTTEQSLWAGIDQVRKGNRISDIGGAVQEVAEAAGFGVVREYVGHGIGTSNARGAADPELPAPRPLQEHEDHGRATCSRWSPWSTSAAPRPS